MKKILFIIALFLVPVCFMNAQEKKETKDEVEVQFLAIIDKVNACDDNSYTSLGQY